MIRFSRKYPYQSLLIKNKVGLELWLLFGCCLYGTLQTTTTVTDRIACLFVLNCVIKSKHDLIFAYSYFGLNYTFSCFIKI